MKESLKHALKKNTVVSNSSVIDGAVCMEWDHPSAFQACSRVFQSLPSEKAPQRSEGYCQVTYFMKATTFLSYFYRPCLTVLSEV